MSALVSHDGVKLAYRVVGEGDPVVLLHALTANSHDNWVATGIVEALNRAGWQAVLLDARGHGGSDRPSEPESYVWERHGRDVITLLDHLGLDRCALVGYSLGAGTAAWVTVAESRVRASVLAGIGNQTIAQWSSELVDAYVTQLTGDGPEPSVQDDREGVFGSSVAVSIASVRALVEPASFDFPQVQVPVLVLNGEADATPDEIASQIPGARSLVVPGDHGTAPLHPEFTAAVLEFLEGAGLR